MSMYSLDATPREARKSRTYSISARFESRLTVGKLMSRSRICALFISSRTGPSSVLFERIGDGNADRARRRYYRLIAIAVQGRIRVRVDAENVGQIVHKQRRDPMRLCEQ